MSSKILSLFCLAFSLTAMAQTSTSKLSATDDGASARDQGSLLLSQPRGGKTLIKLSPTYGTSEYGSKSRSSEYGTYSGRTTQESKIMEVQAKHGISDNIGAGVNLNYGQQFQRYTESNNEDSGLASPNVFMQLKVPGNSNAFVGTVGYTPKLFEHECNYNRETKSTNCDRYSSGQMANVSAGWETYGAVTLGVGVKADLLDVQTYTSKTNGSENRENTWTGGNVYGLGGYGEYPTGLGPVGLSIDYSHMTAQQSPQENAWSHHYDTIGGSLYGSLLATKNFEVMPSVSYKTYLTKEIQHFDQTSTIEYVNEFRFAISAMIGI